MAYFSKREQAFIMRVTGSKFREIGAELNVCIQRARVLFQEGERQNRRRIENWKSPEPRIQGFKEDVYGVWIGEGAE